TEVRYPPGADAQAHLVARYLDATPQLIPDPDVDKITVVTGPELKGVLDTPRPPEAVPTTTSTSTTSTTSTTSEPSTTTTPPARGDDETDDDDEDRTEVSIPLVEGIGPAGEGRAYLPGDPPPGESCG
ncbi:MAG: hypothetical protein KDB09_14685, partial [Acidimicrobiales bacterium]|nr:hypothetical protein [Acidimicrobiales bacterium]